MPIADFIKKGYWGDYSRIGIETIYFFDKRTKQSIHVFTKIRFLSEKDSYRENKPKLYTDIAHKIGLGYTSGERSIDWFNEFYKNCQSGRFIDNETEIKIGELDLIEKQFISKNSNKKIYDYLGESPNSYIFEFWDVSKNTHTSFKYIRKKFEKIKQVSGIDLSKMPERLGNIMIQFPCQLLELEDKSRRLEHKLKLKWRLGKNSDHIICLKRTSTESDNSLEVLNLDNDELSFTFEIDKPFKYEFIDTQNDLVIFDKVYVGSPLYLESSAGKVIRKLHNIDSSIEVHGIPGKTGLQNDKVDILVKNQINSEIYEKQLSELKVKQYNKHTSEIDDIVELIKKHGSSGVWIWDPYLSATDIIKIVVNNYSYMSEVRALCSKKVYKTGQSEEKKNREKWFLEQKKLLTESSDGQGLNLDFRCLFETQHDNFHDRFLIFPNADNYFLSRAWSLGISINQFGKEHHIIYELDYPNLIVEEFDRLWNITKEKHKIYTIRPQEIFRSTAKIKKS